MKNVLITCAGGAGSLLLAETLSKDYQVHMADAGEVKSAISDAFPFQTIPFGSDPAFPGALRSLIAEWKIDVIAPGADEELMPCHQLREEGLVECVMPSGSFVELCLDKRALMQALDHEGISHLLPWDAMNEVRYPAIAKPVHGRGSRQAERVEDPSQLQAYFDRYGTNFTNTVVQPAIDGVEYTVSVIVNNRNVLLGVVPKKIIEKRGITKSAVTEKNAIIEDTCRMIVERFQPSGPCNVQLMVKDGVCYVFEINPRLSTTAVLTTEAFGNEIELYIRFFDQEKPGSLPNMKEGITMIRGDETEFFDVTGKKL